MDQDEIGSWIVDEKGNKRPNENDSAMIERYGLNKNIADAPASAEKGGKKNAGSKSTNTNQD
jgi:hypothetical protein